MYPISLLHPPSVCEYVSVKSLISDCHADAHTAAIHLQGMFTRLMKKIPALDWYWIWTPEG